MPVVVKHMNEEATHEIIDGLNRFPWHEAGAPASFESVSAVDAVLHVPHHALAPAFKVVWSACVEQFSFEENRHGVYTRPIGLSIVHTN